MAVINVIHKHRSLSRSDLESGAIILVDKPYSWTSFDVVNKIRGAIKGVLKVKKFKVGHAGTLDPLATGLLLICVGPATKKIESLQGEDKVYSGEIFIGATRPSYDRETEIDCYYPYRKLSLALLRLRANQFQGDQQQIPPAFSAIKKNGVTQYKLARRGEKVELPARSIRVDIFDILSLEDKRIHFYVKCAKGTYIRSLAYDYGKAMHSGAYLHSLKREKVGEYDVKDAFSVEEITQQIRSLI